MVMASDALLRTTVIPAGEWVMAPGETVSERRVFRRKPALCAAITPVIDSAAIIAGYFVAGLPNPLLAGAIVVVYLAISGTYRRRLTLSSLDVAPPVVLAAAVGAVLATIIVGEDVWLRDLFVPIAAASVAGLIGRFLAYSLTRLLRHSSVLRSRVVVVGADPVGMALTQRMIEDPGFGLQPVLMIDDESLMNVVPPHDLPVHSVDSGLQTILRTERIAAAVIAFPLLGDDRFRALLADLERVGCEIFIIPRLWEGCPVSRGSDRVGTVPLMRIRNSMPRNPMRHVKSAIERFIAAVALVTVAPMLAVVAAAQKLSHPEAPVLFRQTRVGLHGREFELLKFRSMTPATDLESQTSWTIVGDSRVDSLGRFLRASSLDELPQLWNIVRGDMALIGPRPERPHFVDQFNSSVPGYEFRHRVRVGLTGWAAVNGLSGDTSIAERARFDNFYITNWSLWFDFKIVLRTVWVLFVKFHVSLSEERRARREILIPHTISCESNPDISELTDRGEDRGSGPGAELIECCSESGDEAAVPLAMVAAFDGLGVDGSSSDEPPFGCEDSLGAGRL
jgi:exopolysaccharide biosynthesis polyprenyl glycosylphosphotransferase